jgi:hypothetical protein
MLKVLCFLQSVIKLSVVMQSVMALVDKLPSVLARGMADNFRSTKFFCQMKIKNDLSMS